MIGNSYLPFKPVKGEAFTLYFENTNFSGSSSITAPASITIYKDGASGNAATNAETSIGLGNKSIVLTASEMNADCVIVHFEYTSAATQGTEGSVIIYTTTEESEGGGGGSGISLSTQIDSSDLSPAANPTVGELFALLARRLKRNNKKI